MLGSRISEGRKRIPAETTYKEWRNGIEKPKTKNAADDLVFDLQRFAARPLPEGDYNLKVRRQVQNRHIEGTKEFQEYMKQKQGTIFKPSKMPPDIDAQALVNEFHGKGTYDPNPRDNSPREIVDTGRVIGQYWNNKTSEFTDTSWLMIVYSKKGTHIYPVRPLEE